MNRYAPLLSPALASSRDARRSPRFGQAVSDQTLQRVGAGLAVAGAALGAYHGYKRDDSVGWAIWWSLMGGLVPIVTIPIALAQGFGQPKAGT